MRHSLALILSATSRSRWAGWLDGIHGITQDLVPQQRSERFAIHHIAMAIEKVANIDLQPRILQNSHRARPIEINENIDVALCAVLAARHRAEDRGMRHAKLAQLFFMS